MTEKSELECSGGYEVGPDPESNTGWGCGWRNSNNEFKLDAAAGQPTLRKRDPNTNENRLTPDGAGVPRAGTATEVNEGNFGGDTDAPQPYSSTDRPPPSNAKVNTKTDGPAGERITVQTTDEQGRTGTQTSTTPYDRVIKRDERMPGGVMATADRMEGPGTESRFDTERFQNSLLLDGRGKGSGFNSFDKGLEGFFGQTYSAYSTRQTAWNDLIDIAKEEGVSPYDLLRGGERAYRPGGRSGGGGGGGSSTTRTFSEANESDVRLLANNLSEEMIGRRINDKEFSRLLSKVRKEEEANPTVTTRSGDTARTSGGMTTEARNEALREVLVENPEFKEYQMGEGALAYTRRYIEEQSKKASL